VIREFLLIGGVLFHLRGGTKVEDENENPPGPLFQRGGEVVNGWISIWEFLLVGGTRVCLAG